MVTKIQNEYETLSKERKLKNVVSKIIVDDVLLYRRMYMCNGTAGMVPGGSNSYHRIVE